MEDFMKKVLVTGAAGFIGKSLVKELIDRGISRISFDKFKRYIFVKFL